MNRKKIVLIVALILVALAVGIFIYTEAQISYINEPEGAANSGYISK